MYLGDGWVGHTGRSARFVVTLDAAYPGIVEEIASAMRALRPAARVTVAKSVDSETIRVYSYGLAWLPLFPQHGPGKKHERPLQLQQWQDAIVTRHPKPFLRGLIHADGCRTINRFTTALPSGRIGEYSYPRYFFSNLFLDILSLFAAACDALGIRWTRSNPRNLSIAHRRSVALLDEFIGPKA